VLFALPDAILIDNGGGSLKTCAIHGIIPKEGIVLFSPVIVAICANLLEMLTKNGVVDLNGARRGGGSDVGHEYVREETEGKYIVIACALGHKR
jgi:hypothetical protein